ncbi:oxidoreductase [Roseicyclus mahoneyensis]|uniref:NAD(P)-dependent dehydrogenase (Short-subunit alcohol dehydrogenase family) n=1 Tax=Roseicyclus mahoneyensis TaxID=164332 RepID=A0A316GJ74_9RHOB|nr:oxidoreductase [Roseicyclus mahoneyensis]PWK60584.1 NAD(P)-dependent dehydrogenase (short-subunit alcohol dehydrogenase family) [Roseicyclus mahoneyensis]
MQVTLKDKVFLITGAARGIGAAIAHQAAESGAAALVLTDLDPFTGDWTCPVETVQADLATPEGPSAIISTALARFGRIDGLVNAAGLTARGSFADADVPFWNRMFSVNTRAPFFLMAGVIADMTARNAPGSIVNIQSMNVHAGAPDLTVYSATKAALQVLTKNAAHAHLRDRIRVNGINLGWVATDTERHLHEVTLGKGAGWLAAQGAKLPLGRHVTAEEAARHAVWLLSEASAPMTGMSLDLEQAVTGAPC